MNSRLSHYHDPVPKFPRRGILTTSNGPVSLPLQFTPAQFNGSSQFSPEGLQKAHWTNKDLPRARFEKRSERGGLTKWQQVSEKISDSKPGSGAEFSDSGQSRRSRQLASLSIADVSPRLALQRILALFQRGDHREAAAFLRRISVSTFRQLVGQLPSDLFVDCLPQSLPLLEALYSKLFLTGGKKLSSTISVSPETVVWQLVKFFARQEDAGLASREGRWELCGPFINTCKRLLSTLITAEPKLIRTVADRKKLLTKVIEGLGQHGMVGSADQSLINLHDGLRAEFLTVREQYQTAIGKLEHLALASKEPLTNGGGKAPVLISHQRQLSLSVSQVQERLIKNKTLFTAVEPAVSCTSLQVRYHPALAGCPHLTFYPQVLIGILQRRIELDKEVLFQFNTIKHEAGLVDLADKNPTIAPTLMKFQRGCHQVRLTAEPGLNLDGDNQSVREAEEQHRTLTATAQSLPLLCKTSPSHSQLSTQKLTQTSSQL